MTKLANATIPVEEARVQERSLSIRVLTLGERQITQTLYKQLVEEDVVDQFTGELKGPVWGWVNLHNDCHHRECEHFHAIWEDNDNLKRSYVYLPWTKKTPYYQRVRTYEEIAKGKPYYDLAIQVYEQEDAGPSKRKMAQEIEELRNSWEQSYKTIEEAGQLFVAVSGVWK